MLLGRYSFRVSLYPVHSAGSYDYRSYRRYRSYRVCMYPGLQRSARSIVSEPSVPALGAPWAHWSRLLMKDFFKLLASSHASGQYELPYG